MQNTFTFRNLAILSIAAVTIVLVFTEGILSALLFAGFFFFAVSLVEIFQRRDQLERGRLILLTVSYTVCILVVLAATLWRYRTLIFLR
jgi:FtsH-binding integral membrane protein